jgi:ubiquitin C-terminal hydrolase
MVCPYISLNGITCLLFCHSVISHHGLKPHCGHYTTYINDNEQWWEFNDRVVSKVPNKTAMLEGLYGGEA